MKSLINKAVTGLVVAMLAGLALAAGATRRDYGERNFAFINGMARTPALKAQNVAPGFANGDTLREPIAGTIPRGVVPMIFKDTVDDRQNAGRRLKNPLAATRANLDRGREVYSNFCLHCHGPLGRGDGPVAQRAPLGMSLLGTQTRKRPDGELFHIITYGRLYMPPHRGMIDAEDRWAAILFVRELQGQESEAAETEASAAPQPAGGPAW